MPTVVQSNKMDVEGAMPIGSIVDAFPNIKVIEAVAVKGIGVVETFKHILREVLNARATSR
ncbi:MAG: hypothetical protein RMK75_07065 [Aquificaceae bacterium]|nr:hypothetical protein [Aquificaceae bacterium]MDW8424061.1 hypothetical protein [Aquificaceae bacterium]